MIIDSKKIISGIKFVGENINSPEQRLIQGATALMTQPFIDLNNKQQDNDTRMMSVARTLAKIIAGTTVGVLVRQLSISLIKAMSQYTYISGVNGAKLLPVSKMKSLFLPLFQKATVAMTATAAAEEMNMYRKGMGTLIGTLVGLATNFLIDAPLTKHLTGVFYKKIKKGDLPPENESSEKGNNRNSFVPSLLLKLQKEVKKWT